MRKIIKGISAVNPVDVKKDYLLYTVDYCIEHGFDHYQLIGPIHDGVKGNIDGMTFSKKYSQFNGEKNAEYVNYCLDCVNEALEKLSAAGVKTYMWHHELDLPYGFTEAFPEVQNDYGDVEVTHPLVKDYLENKIKDFFDAYPKMDGIILTLHETKVPLLKLKKQKLEPTARVKYVTEILYNTCKSLGKELIVRPFASIEEDYEMMTKAYEEISRDLIIMDKWTQFDWSLCLPSNRFYAKIKNNPLFVETDIFGEFFGKGRLPLMLKDHIETKFAYCENFSPVGYVSRIDRSGRDPFGEVNEVNLEIMHAVLSGDNVDERIDAFFEKKYGEYGKEVRQIMENTEDILKRIIYLKGYYYSQLSLFPEVNHSKNHFYFEMMRDDCAIRSEEWFIPPEWDRGSLESVLTEKSSAAEDAEAAYNKLISLEGKLPDKEYKDLYTKFRNLELVSKLWVALTDVFYNYTKFFEYKDGGYEDKFRSAAARLDELHAIGKEALGDDFYGVSGESLVGAGKYEQIPIFTEGVIKSFEAEKAVYASLADEENHDLIVCGSAFEGHKLMKEVNFSDTVAEGGEVYRLPGNAKGAEWSTIKAHGWFSYEIKVRPNTKNTVEVVLGSYTDTLDIKITLGDAVYELSEKINGAKAFNFEYTAGDEEAIRIKFDKISGHTPKIYTVKVK